MMLIEHISVFYRFIVLKRAVIRYNRLNVSLHLASDYYLVNIDSQVASVLMRQRIASSSYMPKTLSIVVGAQSRNFMQTLYSPFDPIMNSMIIHRFIIKRNLVTNLDSFFPIMDEIH